MRAEPAFDSEYGERGSSGSVSRVEPTSTEPYTSSVPMWTTRPTSRRRAMSTTMLVPKQLVVTKSSDPAIDRSTWISAAKCTTASPDFIAGSSAAGYIGRGSGRARVWQYLEITEVAETI